MDCLIPPVDTGEKSRRVKWLNLTAGGGASIAAFSQIAALATSGTFSPNQAQFLR
jgi:acetate kinase